jgi:hypothetical protein
MTPVSNSHELVGQIETLRSLVDNIEWSLIDQLCDLQHTLDHLDERLDEIEAAEKSGAEVVEV